MNGESNHLFESDEFRKVAFFIARGAFYITKKPPYPNSDKAVFVLRGVDDGMQADWQAHKDSVSARALYEAQDILRDVLHGKEPR
jgi:hypothetical protein